MINSMETMIAADAMNFRSKKYWNKYNIHRAEPQEVLDKLYEYKRFFGAGMYEMEINRAIELYRYLCDKPRDVIFKKIKYQDVEIGKKTLQDYIVPDSQLIKLWD